MLADEGQVRQPLCADADGASGDARLGHLVHGAGVAHRLARVSLGGGDESSLEAFQNGVDPRRGGMRLR